jgi:hypothetical protein
VQLGAVRQPPQVSWSGSEGERSDGLELAATNENITLRVIVAMSRLHENRHYLSDVIFGAGVGYMVGHTVTRHGKGNFTEFATYPVAVPRGVGIAFVRTTPSPKPKAAAPLTGRP